MDRSLEPSHTHVVVNRSFGGDVLDVQVIQVFGAPDDVRAYASREVYEVHAMVWGVDNTKLVASIGTAMLFGSRARICLDYDAGDEDSSERGA